jgi:hypothetical protein
MLGVHFGKRAKNHPKTKLYIFNTIFVTFAMLTMGSN